MENCTVVYQSGIDLNYQYGAFHIKGTTSEKLQRKLDLNDIKVIDHIIEYKESIMGNSHELIRSEDGIINFFDKWNVKF